MNPPESTRSHAAGAADAHGAASSGEAAKPAHRSAHELAEFEPDDFFQSLLKILVGMLLVARLLLPTEASVQGDTLWLVQLWLLTGLFWIWTCYRSGDYRFRFNRLDALLWLVVAGHAVATFVVLRDGGQKRAAINMTWEWVGLTAAFFLTRQVVRTGTDVARLVYAVTVVAALLAGLGLWQHHVYYPMMSSEYAQKRGELDELLSKPLTGNVRDISEKQNRAVQLISELTARGIPLSGPARALWEARLRCSSEPFGTFALANTLSGVLVVWFVVLAGIFALGRNAMSRLPKYTIIVLLATMGYCLVLTKSRTAWVGLVAGLALWGGLTFARRRFSHSVFPNDEHTDAPNGPSRAWIKWGAGAVVVIGVLFAVAAASGGFDRLVISESAKSLRYRFQYWTGAWQVVLERPILGTGPGNFRTHYLKHKLAESSEEIADPHNFVLDIWTSGGIAALLGLAGLVTVAVLPRLWRPRKSGPVSAHSFPTHHANGSISHPAAEFGEPLAWGAALAFLLVLGVGVALGQINDYRRIALPVMMVCGLVLYPLTFGRLTSFAVPGLCYLAAAAALFVHLLGAGGIEMPAIVQTALVLLIAGSGPATAGELRNARQSVWPAVPLAILIAVLFGGCLLTATIPVVNSQSLTLLGQSAQLEGNLQRAERYYRNASAGDPFAVEPLEKLAGLYFKRWSDGLSDDAFRGAVEVQRMVIDMNPYSPFHYQQLGDWYRLKYERTPNRDDARAAADAYARAVDRYPNSSALRTALADALALAGDPAAAAREAAWALELDRINRTQGHSDKYLSEQTLKRVQELAGTPAVDSTAK